MGSFGSENFYFTGNPQNLEEIIKEFPSRLKQAMFAAASKQVIKRKTWDGCAFNAAGTEVNEDAYLTSAMSVAVTFNISAPTVSQFIHIWDSLAGTDEECTQLLRNTIERVGLFSEPGDKLPRIIRKKVYENQQAKLREQFDSLMVANAVPDTDFALELLTVW